MAVQNDNTLVTKGDLKSLYANKIAPYLGGGVSYYYTDRSGQELNSINMILEADQSVSAGSPQNTLINFIKDSGSYTVTDHKVLIPGEQRIQIDATLQAVPGANNNVDGTWEIYDYTNNVTIAQCVFTFYGSGYSWCGNRVVQYDVPSDGALIGIKITGLFYATKVFKLSSFTIQEIGRVVDPVKYVSNNSDLQETPVGNIISYMGNTVPKHYLACDGTIYNIGSYPELEDFIINEFGSINYFGGDGATTWAVPDLRGEFLRGSGTNSHTNQGSGLAVGSHQNATEVPYIGVNTTSTYCLWTSSVGQSSSSSHGIQPINTDSGIKGSNTTSTNGYQGAVNSVKTTWAGAGNLSNYTTRPTNTSVKYCIKYESTYHAFFSNAAYKVEASFGLNYNSTLQSYVSYAMSYITGDSSLMNENYFIAPVDGWYMVSFKSNQISYTKPAVQYLQINDVSADAFTDATGSGTSHSNFGVSMTHTIYLSKGDKVNYRVWTNGNTISLPSVRRASFCLLTSNYNPTIVSADTVYSENEQMIGYWKDGKPLYQKTISATSQPNINTWGSGYEIGASVDTIVKVSGRLVLNNNSGTYTGNLTFPTVNNDDSILYIGTDNNHSSLPNRVGVRVGKVEYTSRPVSITVQYTKTTDTASSLQVENSLLLNRPDLWEVGTVYNFGGGLYGQRFTGNLVALAKGGNRTSVQLAPANTFTNGRIFDFGGCVTAYNSNVATCVHPIGSKSINNSTDSSATGYHIHSGIYITGDGRLQLGYQAGDHYTTTANTYDVWVTYKK